MEKIRLPIKTKIVIDLFVLVVLICLFIFFSLNSSAGYYGLMSSFAMPFAFIFSYLSFAILLLRRIKWACYGVIVNLILWTIFFLHPVISLLNLIFLTLLFLDRKKYLEIASLEISPKRKKMNNLVTVILLAVLIGGTVSLLSIEEDPCRGRSCRAGIQANLKTIAAQGELFYDDNNNCYSSVVLPSPFSGECPEFGDGNTMFAEDRTIADAIEIVRKMGRDGHINCHMSADAQQWAVDVGFRNNSGSWCTDSTGYAGETAINPTTGLCSVSLE